MPLVRSILICLEVVVLFNFIILSHELGHFLAARWRGMVVDRFSIWFGKPLWSKKIGSVKYCLGSIPFGGFVSLPQMAPMEMLEGRTLPTGVPMRPMGPFDKIVVSVAGPLFSLLLGVLFACVVWVVGVPESESEGTTTIGYVVPDSPAEKAGLLPGDRITAVDGHEVHRFSGMGASVAWRIVSGLNPKSRIDFERDGKAMTLEVEPTKEPVKGWQRESLRQIKIEPAQTPKIARVDRNSPAERAGLRPNDIVLAADGRRLFHPGALSDYLKATGGAPVTLTISNESGIRSVTARPEVPLSGDTEKQPRPRLGLQWDLMGLAPMSHPSPAEQVGSVFANVFGTLEALFSPHSDIKPQHLSGPVGILRIFYNLFESPHGWRMAIWFSVMLNINLALMNLLPIPMLDGGHVVLALAEAVRRRPLSESIVMWVQTCGAVLVIGFILYVTSFDVIEMGGRSLRGGKPDELIFAPQPGSTPTPTPAPAGR